MRRVFCSLFAALALAGCASTGYYREDGAADYYYERDAYYSGGYYAIAPMLPELAARPSSDRPPLNREYSSADAPVGLERTAALLRENHLMLDQVDLAEVTELLR